MALSSVSGGVNATFDSHSEELKWSDSGTGVLEGVQLIENPASGVLTVGPKVGEWLLNGNASSTPLTVASKGTLVLQLLFRAIEGGGAMAVQCTDSSEGNLAPGGEGEFTTVKLTGCIAAESNAPGCHVSETVTVTALDLPWRTVLLTHESATRELILEDGKGLPGYRAECKSSYVSTGTGRTSMAVKTVTGGVNQTFDTHSEELGWSDAAAGVLEGAQLIENPLSGTLTFKEGI